MDRSSDTNNSLPDNIQTQQSNSEPEEIHNASTRAKKLKTKVRPGIRISLFLSLIIYIAMLGVGIWGLKKCTAEKYIPFFLIVTGGIAVLSRISSLIRDALLKEVSPVHPIEASLYSVETVFLILGTFWVFNIYKPNFQQRESASYCNKTVYYFAFTYLAIIYSIIFILLICFACFLGCIYFVKLNTRNEDDPEASTRPIRTSEEQS